MKRLGAQPCSCLVPREGPAPRLNEDVRICVSEAIREHQEPSGWRIEPGPPIGCTVSSLEGPTIGMARERCEPVVLAEKKRGRGEPNHGLDLYRRLGNSSFRRHGCVSTVRLETATTALRYVADIIARFGEEARRAARCCARRPDASRAARSEPRYGYRVRELDDRAPTLSRLSPLSR